MRGVEQRSTAQTLALLLPLGSACSAPSVSISEDGLTPQQRASGQLSGECVVLREDLRCWYREPHELDQALLMLRDELEPPLPLPPVDLGRSSPVTSFVTGLLHDSRCAAIDGEGIKCWGFNDGTDADHDDYQLGVPDLSTILGDTPDERGAGLPFVRLGATDLVSVTNSSNGYCGLFSSGRVKCWGAGRPTLGLGDLENRGDDLAEMGDSLPYLDLGTDVHAVGLAGRSSQTCIWADDGRIKCWGHNRLAQLGTPPSDPIGDDPGEMGDALPFVDLGEDFFVVQVTTGTTHSCALSDDGRVKCWGANADVDQPEPPTYEVRPPGNFGRLGTGDETVYLTATGDSLPEVDLGSTAGPVVAVAAGWDHTCALFDTGRVKCWGNGGGGKLGYGSRDNIGDEPGEMGDDLPFVDLGDRIAIKLGCEASLSCVLTDDDTVLCWGSVGGESGNYQPGATPGTMGDTLIPVATAEELGSEP